MLVHQLPPEPPALRVRIWRRLLALGALQLKSSVYLLPESEGSLEDFAWLVEEIRSGGGEATVWRATAVEGVRDAGIVAQFQEAAGAEYAELEQAARALRSVESGPERKRALARLRARFREVEAHDHFAAPRREVVGAVLDALQGAAERPAESAARQEEAKAVDDFRGKTWVTRENVRVDRMTSAWLIRRFIDPQARFAFTRDKQYAAQAGELRFDMYAGEFTHEGELCTFEVLLRRFALRDPGLARLGEIVHDIDLKEHRYGHPETPGIAAVLAGFAERIPDDGARIEAACVMLDGLLGELRNAAVRA
jgi:hypothetical protein